ncbi:MULTISPECIES: FxDxF family PEP-CTERM protein [unclassified Methylophilus]|jgi:hypothetical protein|uniref:FxDxF family PEP-CTERM protein n=1 Tax=unclassified Methylophilus TaxID=2630143 RepID=UPI0023B35593|nr:MULTISPECIES: FxDxF family PEP-CTERM protein [unclassified Methylophilus]MDF0376831.1 PEP-CTERM sorting domain-containing protein [Methylophilus sp. YYY-1]MDT7850730.1 FxDxF family PEP-CTERM protein [Methylophilus sp. VKM B-3414]
MFKSFFKLSLLAIAIAASTSVAQAQDFGPYTSSQSLDFTRLKADADFIKNSGSISTRGAYFDDTYQINLLQVSDFSYNISEITTADDVKYDVTFLNFGFYDINGAAVTTFTNLAAGTYFLTASGKLAGTDGGDFNVSFNITPVASVPEADSYALMLAGLGLVGMISRRRSK